jgi:hypothetical protein
MNSLPPGLNKSIFPDLKLLHILVVSIALFSFCCSTREKKIDIGGIDLDIEILRLDRDLFAIEIDNIPEHLTSVSEKYGEFFEVFNHLIIRLGSHRSPAYPEYLRGFLTDFDIYRLNAEVERIFPDLANISNELELAFKRYMFYFPGYPVPDIFSYISGFNQSVVTAENILGIGLDKYMGAGHNFYHELQLPYYQRVNMHPGKIPSDCMIAWAMMEFEMDENAGNLLSHMIHHGKVLYFTDAMLPNQHDTLKAGFSLSGLEWCRKNESQMWTYLVENKLLFSTDARTINRFINPGPFTAEFTRESPGRAAVWLGWQIVRSYMKRNSHISLEELMLDTDYHAILTGARYRP